MNVLVGQFLLSVRVSDAVTAMLLFDGLNVSLNQLVIDPESLWDSKSLGVARAAHVLLRGDASRQSLMVVKRALAVNTQE